MKHVDDSNANSECCVCAGGAEAKRKKKRFFIAQHKILERNFKKIPKEFRIPGVCFFFSRVVIKTSNL